MSPFQALYDGLRYPISGGEDAPGFRPAQVAALQAVCGHLFQHPAVPAIVTMPTGSGKTLILTTLPIALRATRVLVLTPSRLVREQIHDEFCTLRDLKAMSAIPSLTAPLKVHATRKTVRADTDWDDIGNFDVTVATVPAISGQDMPLPPKGLFDLVLVDEAHHAPAATWKRILTHLNDSKQVLFTATPFRRDEKMVPGRMVFTYALEQANADRIFGGIRYEPVLVRDGQNVDVEIARAAERRFRADTANGLHHLVMVRMDSKRRGKDLFRLYQSETKLRLAYATGDTSLKQVRTIVEQLRKRELDGLVCVNMFGEGFNLPNLKIAAIHSPHKSLAVTLQFVGRFARTTANNIAGATFLAEPTTSSRDLDQLYSEGAAWQKIIANLSASRIADESRARAALDTFVAQQAPDLADFSLAQLRPYFHVKVYRAETVSFEVDGAFPKPAEVKFAFMSDDLRSAVYITQEEVRARWTSDPRFNRIGWDLYVLFYHTDSQLLFICASDRSVESYERLSRIYSGGEARVVSAAQVNRALKGIEGARFFHVGMRKRSRLGLVESYRTLAGPRADHAIQHSDRRMYDRGHCFGKGKSGDEEVTLGVSSSGKIWSHRSRQIPYLIDWCTRIAINLSDTKSGPTGSPLDGLNVGSELQTLPAGIIGALWSPEIFETPRTVVDPTSGEILGTLLDFDIAILASIEGSVNFVVSRDSYRWTGTFSFEQDHWIEADDGAPLSVEVKGKFVPLEVYLSDDPPVFFTERFEAIEGLNLYAPPEDAPKIDPAQLSAIDWSAANINIQKEKPQGPKQDSIFEWLTRHLIATAPQFVFCDDAAGEVADFIALQWEAGAPVLELYHCKKSSEPFAGLRVADLYEVAFQAAKCAAWAQQTRLLDRIIARHQKRPARLIKGSLEDLKSAFSVENRQRLHFRPIIVQPGLSVSGATDGPVGEVLAAANLYVVESGLERLRIYGSP